MRLAPMPVSEDSTSLAYKLRERLQQRLEIGLQRGESGVLDQCALVHVVLAVHFDLQAVAALQRTSVLAHELNALVRMIDRHGIAHVAQRGGDKSGELRRACRTVAVAQDKVRAPP